MGIVVHAEEKFAERRAIADKKRGFSNQETDLQKRTRELRAKLDRSRGRS